MSPEQRQQRLEATAEVLRDFVAAVGQITERILDAADRAVPVVDDEEYQQLLRDHGEVAIAEKYETERAERAEAAARDFAKALREIDDDHHGCTAAQKALARHPEYSESGPIEGGSR